MTPIFPIRCEALWTTFSVSTIITLEVTLNSRTLDVYELDLGLDCGDHLGDE